MKMWFNKAFSPRTGLSLIFLWLVVVPVLAQHRYLPLNNYRSLLAVDTSLSAVHYPDIVAVTHEIDTAANWWKRKFFQESLFDRQAEHLSLSANLIYNSNTYQSSFNYLSVDSTGGGNSYRLSRGLMLHGVLGDKLKFWTAYLENQAFFPKYLDDHMFDNREQVFTNGKYIYDDNKGMIPGQGRAKRFKDTGFDWGWAFAGLRFEATDWLTITTGNDKLFIGHGYRSLLLSDAAFNAPHLTFHWKWNNWTYLHSIRSLQNLTRLAIHNPLREERFLRKTQSIHYLEWQPLKWLSAGLFESTIWQTEHPFDSTNRSIGMYSPVLGTDLLFTEGWSGANNLMHGLNLAIGNDSALFYGQLLLDDPKLSQLGYQVGVKALFHTAHFDIASQIEYASASSGTYEVEDHPYQSYTHYNQYLGHIHGGAFGELNGRVFVRRNRFGWLTSANVTTYASGGKVTFLYSELTYSMNPVTNLQVYMGAGHRIERDNADIDELILSLGFRTNLWSEYHDL